MSYLESAKKLKEDYDYQITFEDYDKQECFKDLLESARSVRNSIIGVCMMKRSKTKDDEDAVKILDEILGDTVNEGEGEMMCKCGHDKSEHDRHGECIADTNPNGKRTVFCKCKEFVLVALGEEVKE